MYAVPTAEPDPGATPETPTRDRLRLLGSYVRPHVALLVVGLGLGVISAGTELATPMVTKRILDGLATSASLRGPVSLLAVLLVAGAIVGYAQARVLGTIAERVILSARTTMIGHLLRTRLSALDNRPEGELVTRVTSDTLLIREASTTSIVYGVGGVISLVGSLVLMGILDLPLLLTTVAVVVVVGVLAMLLMPALVRAQQAAQAEVGDMGGRLAGILRAMRTVKASRAEDRETERIVAYARRSTEKAIRGVRLESLAWTITGAGISLAVMLVLGLGAHRVATGALEVSSLIAFLLYLFGLTWPVMMLTMSVTALQSGLAAAARIGELVELPVEDLDAVPAGGRRGTADDPSTAAPGSAAAAGGLATGDAVLALDAVTVRYAADAEPALRDVTLRIPRRGHIAVVGPSGAGKTTLFSALLRFVNPDAGTVTLDGVPYDELSIAAVRSRFTYVEQDTPLVPGTLRENLLYAAPEADEAGIWAVLDAVRLADRVRAHPDGLDADVSGTVVSGGERQRIALARALLAQRDVLLLDEVTAQLDGLTERVVADSVKRQAARGAVITIAHRLSSVVDADRIVLLDGGRVRAVGTHDELLAADELYAELVAALRLSSTTTEAVSAAAAASSG